MALAAILASVDPKPIIVHVVHDLRPTDMTVRDRDAVISFAAELGCECIHQSIHTKSLPGNQEHNARTARYDTLAQIALDQGIEFVATGHHADDQLETMLMNLSRGAGMRGLAGINDTRSFQGTTIIRPMLGITHQDAIDLCHELEINFTHDHSNDDLSLTRNRLRHTILPALREFDPDIAQRASTSSDSCRSTINALSILVERLLWSLGKLDPDEITWSRTDLETQPCAALVELMWMSINHLCKGIGSDRVNNASLNDVVRAITDSSTEPRSCRLGPIVVEVTARTVVTRACAPQHGE